MIHIQWLLPACPVRKDAIMVEVRCEIDIRGTAETVFATLVDLRGYGRWLANSAAYTGTTEISDEPITVGTTYVEPSSSGVRRGTVTELEAPTLIGFHQPMTMKPRFFGTIDIHVRYTLTPGDGTVHLDRVATLTLPWQLRPLAPVVVPQFRKEGRRTVEALKKFTESPG
jgi:uncharacterized protein YndB with AHSA1/START domain